MCKFGRNLDESNQEQASAKLGSGRLNRLGRYAVENFALLTCLFAILTIYANWAWFTGDVGMAAYVPPFVPDYNIGGQTLMGVEYYNIAEAVHQGRGYSDPFGDETGPTGWSPPVLTYLMAAGLYLVNGSRGSLTVCFYGMQVVVLAFTTTILFSFAYHLKRSKLALLAAMIVIIPNFKWMFQLTHDCVFQMLWVDLIVLGLWAWRFPPVELWKNLVWGFLGGFCALSSPIVGFTWAATTAATWGWRNWKAVLIAAVASIAVVTPWVAYQSMRLKTFVPIKSNAGFEQFQGQLVLPDGLIVENSYWVHPYWPNCDEGKRYRKLGETKYIKEKRNQFRTAVRLTPWDYLRKIRCRALAATVWLDSEIPSNRKKPSFMVLRLLAMLPFLGLILVIIRRPENANWVLPVVCCYIAYLIPYLLVAYYERYAVPLTLPRMIFTLWVLCSISDYLRGLKCTNEQNNELSQGNTASL